MTTLQVYEKPERQNRVCASRANPQSARNRAGVLQATHAESKAPAAFLALGCCLPPPAVFATHDSSIVAAVAAATTTTPLGLLTGVEPRGDATAVGHDPRVARRCCDYVCMCVYICVFNVSEGAERRQRQTLAGWPARGTKSHWRPARIARR